MSELKNKYLSLEKTKNETISMLPSIKKKALQLSKKYLGCNNLSGLVTYLINKEE